MKKQAIDVLLFIIFSAFTYLQFNDPDPLKWIAIYGIVSLVSLMAFFQKYHAYTLISLFAVLAVWAFLMLPNVMEWLTTSEVSEILGEMMDDKPYIEGSRELGGLVLAAGAVGYHLWRSRQ